MAIRSVLKMIEKRELAMAKRKGEVPAASVRPRLEVESDADNADLALQILGIAVYGHVPPGGGEEARTLKLATWATQAAISRPGRRAFTAKDRDDIIRYTVDPEKLRWPRGHRA